MADIFGPICDAAAPEALNCLARTATRREAMRSFAFARQKKNVVLTRIVQTGTMSLR